MEKQKTAPKAGAFIDDVWKWSSVDWNFARRQIRRLQVRIAKAVKENRWNKVKTTISDISLVLRQVAGCETSDLQQGEIGDALQNIKLHIFNTI